MSRPLSPSQLLEFENQKLEHDQEVESQETELSDISGMHETDDYCPGPSDFGPITEVPDASRKENVRHKPKATSETVIHCEKSGRKTSKPKRFDEEVLLIIQSSLAYDQAMTGEDKDKWLNEMEDEYNALIENKVKTIVPGQSTRKRWSKANGCSHKNWDRMEK